MLSFLFYILYIYFTLIQSQDNFILQNDSQGPINQPTRIRMVNISPLQRSGVSKGIPRDDRHKNDYKIVQHGATIKSFSIDGQPSRLIKELSIPIRSSTSYISTEGGTSKQKDTLLLPITVNEALKEDTLVKSLQRTTMSPKSYQYKDTYSLQTNTIEESNNNDNKKQTEVMHSTDTEYSDNDKQIRVPVPIIVQETTKYDNEKKSSGVSQTHSPKFTVMQTTQTPLRQAIGAVQQLLPPAPATGGLGNLIFPQNMGGNIQSQGSFNSNFNNLDIKPVPGVPVQSTPSSNVPVKNEQPQIGALQGLQQLNLPQLSSPSTIIPTPTIQFTTQPPNGNIDVIKHAQETMEAAMKANQIRPGSGKYEQKGCVWDIVSNSCKDIFNLKWCERCEDFGNIFVHDCKCTIDHITQQPLNTQPISMLQQTSQQLNGPPRQQNFPTLQQQTTNNVLQSPLFNNQPPRTSFLVV